MCATGPLPVLSEARPPPPPPGPLAAARAVQLGLSGLTFNGRGSSRPVAVERAGGWVGERVQLQPKTPFDLAFNGPASESAGRRALALQPWGSAPVGARDRAMRALRGVCGTGLLRALLKPTRDVLGLSKAR
jgi:hypothetical protein